MLQIIDTTLHCKLFKKEKEMIYQHFGYSENLNQNVYQAPPGSLQLQTMGQWLLQIQNSLKSVYQSKSKGKRKAVQATESVGENKKNNKNLRSNYWACSRIEYGNLQIIPILKIDKTEEKGEM